MINSTRRVSSTLFILGIGLLIINLLVPSGVNPKSPSLAAFLPLALEPDVANLSNPQTTADVAPNPESIMRRWIPRETIRLTRAYALFDGLITLIVLEFLEVHYLKALMPHRRRRFKN